MAPCSHFRGNLFICDHKDSVVDALAEHLEIGLTRKYLWQGEIKKIMGEKKV